MVNGETSYRRGRKMYRRLACVIYSRENRERERERERGKIRNERETVWVVGTVGYYGIIIVILIIIIIIF